MSEKKSCYNCDTKDNDNPLKCIRCQDDFLKHWTPKEKQETKWKEVENVLFEMLKQCLVCKHYHKVKNCDGCAQIKNTAGTIGTIVEQAEKRARRELADKFLLWNKRRGKYCCKRDGLCEKYDNDCDMCVILEALAELESENKGDK